MDQYDNQSSNFPSTMGKVAIRELAANGISDLEEACQYTVEQLLGIHGVGPKAVNIIKKELDKRNKALKL